MSDTITLIQAIVNALTRASDHNPNDQVAPSAVLWPDAERQWEGLLPALRARLPIITLGPYAPQERTGPAYYLRCMIDRTLEEDRLPADATPIVYLPGVSRQELRAIDECPRHLQPLAELQYRGVLWTHKNGRDWTVSAFLQNDEEGLGVSVAGDAATREALVRALPALAQEPLAHLRREITLRAPFLDALLIPDAVRRLLEWMNDPEGFRAQVSDDEWIAFQGLISRGYGVSPEADGELLAAQRLGRGEGAWAAVWRRYQEAPEAYPNLPELLRRARPQRALFESLSPYWPQDNASAEVELRGQLSALAGRNPADARAALLELEAEHGARRAWVWAKMGEAPLAGALQHLAQLASATEAALGGPTVGAIAEAYAARGWQADAAVVDALAGVEAAGDLAAVRTAIRSVYRPWLHDSATAFQQAVLASPEGGYGVPDVEPPSPGTCVLFSDALRYDAAQRLALALGRYGLTSSCGWRLAALPTVTATTKPALVPVGGAIAGDAPGLTPRVKDTGTPLTADSLRRLLVAAGYQILMGDETGDPGGVAWTEMGAVDQYGHGHGWRVAGHLLAELRALEGRIVALLDAGWQRVQVVTDHGWLLLPGGLPKVELAQQLALERKGRCAVLKEGTTSTDHLTVPWHWNSAVAIAVAPGIACYEAGREYEHGGVSPQECVVPILTVRMTAGSDRPRVEIRRVFWRGLRCVVELGGAAPGILVDIRTKAADAATSLVDQPKPPGKDGAVSLPVPDDEREGEAAFVVVCMENGALLAQDHTTIGG